MYFYGDKILYDKDNNIIELANKVSYLWREINNIYYVSDNILYNYNFKTKETKKLVKNPHTILGKYKDSIITYSGRTIYSINSIVKTKLFKDGYYLNKAVLYRNKVYGIPASNVYEYNFDTLKVKKVTNNPESSYLRLMNNELWIVTVNNKKGKNNYVYSKIKDNELKQIFTIKGVEYLSDEKVVKDGIVIETSKSLDDSIKGNRLLYIQDRKIKK